MSKTTGSDARIDSTFERHFSSLGDGVRPIQRKVIASVLDGNNTLALMPTGSGKSLCYWIAGLALGGTTLVVSPLTALMDEQAMKLESFGCKTLVLHSGVDAKAQYRALTDIHGHRLQPDFIFLSPERIATDGFLEFVLRSVQEQINLVVIDEAHCISQWGLDFRPFYKEIPHFLRAVFDQKPVPPVLGLTATLNPKDTEQICRDFAIAKENIKRGDMLLRPEIFVQVEKVPDEDTKDVRLWQLLEEHGDEKVLVYLDRKGGKRSTETLAEEAQERGFTATFFHGDLSSAEKADIISRFKAGELLTVFATSAFGMGIDIPDIRGVVHYLLPESAEEYYQQIGRAGRDGQPAWAHIFYSDKNIDVRKKYYIGSSFPGEEDIQHAFTVLTDSRLGNLTVDYFGEGESTQSGYHYLVRTPVVQPLCKGVQSIDVFKEVRNGAAPDFAQLRATTRQGGLIFTARKSGQAEAEVMRKIYAELAQDKLKMARMPGKCMVVQSFAEELPEELLAEIMEDVAAKKAYRTQRLEQFTALLDGFTNSAEFHMAVGEYLGIDKYGRSKIHRTLSGDFVRSKSEVIIANILFQSGIPFKYESFVRAPDGSWFFPDFTIESDGTTYYWEHLGMLDVEDYERDWQRKRERYETFFPAQLITTRETSTLSEETKRILTDLFGDAP